MDQIDVNEHHTIENCETRSAFLGCRSRWVACVTCTQVSLGTASRFVSVLFAGPVLWNWLTDHAMQMYTSIPDRAEEGWQCMSLDDQVAGSSLHVSFEST